MRLFPWSGSIPYEWTPWFAWYPVRCESVGWRWMCWVEVRMHGEVVPIGFGWGELTEWTEYRCLTTTRFSARGRWLFALMFIVPAALALTILFMMPSRWGFGGW